MNGGQRNGTNAQIWGKKTTRIMMATVPHVISGLGLRKFQADGFLLTRVYKLSPHSVLTTAKQHSSCWVKSASSCARLRVLCSPKLT